MSSSQQLMKRYIWAVGAAAAQIPIGKLVASRYKVVGQQIWQDTLPDWLPDIPSELPEEIMPYLRLFPYRQHVPEVYGYVTAEEGMEVILLLENVPVTSAGEIYPTIAEAWSGATAVRSVYWLWQISQLWTPLWEQGVASSLLVRSNIRVQGGRVWLLELYADNLSKTPQRLSLGDLATCWLSLISQSNSAINQRLQDICSQMSVADASISGISPRLNQLLLEVAAQQPLHLEFAGASDVGLSRIQNEDSCFPQTVFPPDSTLPDNETIPGLAIVCDGVGGHEGGEVASQMAVRALCLQMKGLLVEVSQQTELVMSTVWMEHLSSVIRVVNNFISALNDDQGRESRQRMATTLVMALQIPQKVLADNGLDYGNSHELYLAQVGDSRAYWITPDYCQLLTVDDNISVREVSMGHALYRQALLEANSGVLTQALGTREDSYIFPKVQRLILAEDGVLLLCSDGLSDRDCVEQNWADYVSMMFDRNISLDEAVQAWVDLANQKNGHDNTSVVLMRCRVCEESPGYHQDSTPAGTSLPTGTVNAGLTGDRDPEFLPQQAAVPLTKVPPAGKHQKQSRGPHLKRIITVCALLAIFLIAGIVALVSWRQLYPEGQNQQRERSLLN